MGKPKNPDTIVLENEYYRRGLREIDVWNHYQKNKRDILDEINRRAVLFFIFVDTNSPIVKRVYDNKPIYLSNSNYDDFIHGRTVSLSVEQERSLDYFIIDIDPTDSNVHEDNKKEAVQDIINLYKSINDVHNIRVTNSANGYHVYGYLKRGMKNHHAVRFITARIKAKLGKKYGIGPSKKATIRSVTLDYTPMQLRGSHTVPYALCRNGLMCMDITDNWHRFKRKDAIIR